jgi:shikimate kinase
MMGAGKSTVGTLLAGMLEVPFIDLDAEIARRAGMPVSEIIRGKGIGEFRAREREALVSLADEESFVMATGGGIVEDPGNRLLMKRTGTVVYLKVAPGTIAVRLAGATISRPLLDGEDVGGSVERILDRRAAWYQEADVVAEAGDGDAATVARRVRDLVGGTS